MKKRVILLIVTVLALLSIIPVKGLATNDENQSQRIELLEYALLSSDPLLSATNYAQGVKDGNGALQFALMDDELQKLHIDYLSTIDWQTKIPGQEIVGFQIAEKYRAEDLYRFEIEFFYKDQSDLNYIVKEVVTLEKFEEKYLLSSIQKTDVKGEIMTLKKDEEGKIVGFFAEALSAEVEGFDKANVILGEETKIYEGFSDRPFKRDELKEGSLVIVSFTNEPRFMIYPVQAKAETIRVIEPEDLEGRIEYRNDTYGFSFYLPESWGGYTAEVDRWEGAQFNTENDKIAEEGTKISIRHPLHLESPRQDIPILIFTQNQWQSLLKEEFSIGAAPIGPKVLGQNAAYVFALPARYNFAYPEGFIEVEEILGNDPLRADRD